MIRRDLSYTIRSFGTEFFIQMKRPEWDDIIRRRNDSDDILNVYLLEEIAVSDLIHAFEAYSTGGEWGVTNHRNYFYYLKHAVSRAWHASVTAAMYMDLNPIMIDGFAIVNSTETFIGIFRKIAEHCPDISTRAYALEQVRIYEGTAGWYTGGMSL